MTDRLTAIAKRCYDGGRSIFVRPKVGCQVLTGVPCGRFSPDVDPTLTSGRGKVEAHRPLTEGDL